MTVKKMKIAAQQNKKSIVREISVLVLAILFKSGINICIDTTFCKSIVSFLYYCVCFFMYFIVHAAFMRIKLMMMMIGI